MLWPSRVRPNPSLNRSSYGRPPWPGLGHAVHSPIPGQGVLPPPPRLARTLGAETRSNSSLPPMKIRRLSILAALASLTATASLAADINVLTAWYGQTCGAAHANVTSHVKWRCDGKSRCQYQVDVNTLGDPAPNCPKNFIVLYGCQGRTAVRLAQLPPESHGRSLELSCDSQDTHK